MSIRADHPEAGIANETGEGVALSTSSYYPHAVLVAIDDNGTKCVANHGDVDKPILVAHAASIRPQIANALDVSRLEVAPEVGVQIHFQSDAAVERMPLVIGTAKELSSREHTQRHNAYPGQRVEASR